MIPDKISKPNKESVLNIVKAHQTAKPKREVFYEGECSLCGCKKLIYKKKHSLCRMCYTWCHKWIKKKYGYYHESKIIEATIAFQEPIPCRFYKVCGNTLPRLNEFNEIRTNRSNVCDQCKAIYQAGIKDGRTKIKHRPVQRIT